MSEQIHDPSQQVSSHVLIAFNVIVILQFIQSVSQTINVDPK